MNTQIERNENFAALSGAYLFPEVAKRRRLYADAHPEKKVISLGIGNTTEPLTPHITRALVNAAQELGTASGYSGYGDEQGMLALRRKISQTLYAGRFADDEVFVSDGAKCDIGRIQILFGRTARACVQDPAYPVYVDGTVIVGAAANDGIGTGTGGASAGNGYGGITYLPCCAENDFFPDLTKIKTGSLVYFCSPNNPTGAVATKAQLTQLVETARKTGSIIIFDAAYSAFIRDETLPKSIYEIDGAKECAIEISSFSKPAGFTGVRLGWSIVPKELAFSDGTKVNGDWNRIMTTLFNGASNIAQKGGLAALESEGLAEMKALVDFYLENVQLIKTALLGDNFKKLDVQVFGEKNSPYLWVKFPGQKSWDVFDKILHTCSVVTTPGSGFGPAGESYIRFSAFGHRQDVIEACERLARFRG
ncbi:MAG: LL-diaminopimelate aminotransferase [Treponemataceae bacterium]|nr:MAG: LL-diaminopimelate aminotransferase [Treponemataceae bacterium]